MTEELISFGIISALMIALFSLVITYQDKQAEKKMKKIPVKIRRRK